MYNKTSIKQNILTIKKIHREVGRAKDLSAPRYFPIDYIFIYIQPFTTYNFYSPFFSFLNILPINVTRISNTSLPNILCYSIVTSKSLVLAMQFHLFIVVLSRANHWTIL